LDWSGAEESPLFIIVHDERYGVIKQPEVRLGLGEQIGRHFS